MSATELQVLLRETATDMRVQHPMSHPRHEMWDQIALLLEETARFPMLLDGAPAQRVLAVARAYRAAIDRPDVS